MTGSVNASLTLKNMAAKHTKTADAARTTAARYDAVATPSNLLGGVYGKMADHFRDIADAQEWDALALTMGHSALELLQDIVTGHEAQEDPAKALGRLAYQADRILKGKDVTGGWMSWRILARKPVRMNVDGVVEGLRQAMERFDRIMGGALPGWAIQADAKPRPDHYKRPAGAQPHDDHAKQAAGKAEAKDDPTDLLITSIDAIHLDWRRPWESQFTVHFHKAKAQTITGGLHVPKAMVMDLYAYYRERFNGGTPAGRLVPRDVREGDVIGVIWLPFDFAAPYAPLEE